MGTRININGKEVRNPFLKLLILAAAIILASVISSVVIFIVLPFIGITIAAALAMTIIVGISILTGLVYLGLGAALIALMKGRRKQG